MNPYPCMDRFSEPLSVVKCECLCGVVLIEGEDDATNCSACHAVVCEKCADANYCHSEDCDHSYCDKCAAGFLPAELNGDCVPCHNEWWHQLATYKRLLAAMMGPLGRTG